MNELQVFRADGDRARGAKTVLVTEADHPFIKLLVASGPHRRLGRHLHARGRPPARGDRRRRDVAPLGATFEDGYRASEVCDAIVRSSAEGRRIPITYRSL